VATEKSSGLRGLRTGAQVKRKRQCTLPRLFAFAILKRDCIEPPLSRKFHKTSCRTILRRKPKKPNYTIPNTSGPQLLTRPNFISSLCTEQPRCFISTAIYSTLGLGRGILNSSSHVWDHHKNRKQRDNS
jgi:hypothetical protein